VPQKPTLSAEKIKSRLTLVVLLKPLIVKANRQRLRLITIKEKVTKSSLNRLHGGFFTLKPDVSPGLLTMPGIPGWVVTFNLKKFACHYDFDVRLSLIGDAHLIPSALCQKRTLRSDSHPTEGELRFMVACNFPELA